MDPREIKQLGVSTYDDFSFTEKSKKKTLLQQKRRLLQVAGANADSLSSADIARLAAALLAK